MSKQSKNHEDDFYEGEQISLDDYYLDDEDYYLDDDIEDEEEHREEVKPAIKADKEPPKLDADEKSIEERQKESSAKSTDVNKEQKQFDAEMESIEKGLKEFNARQKKVEGKTQDLTIKRKENKVKKSQDTIGESKKEDQASDGEDRNIKVQDQEDMKKESANKSGKKKADSGRSDSAPGKSKKPKTSSGKNDVQKSGTGKSGASRNGSGKSGVQKSNPGKSGPRKTNSRSGAKPSGKKKNTGLKVAAITFGVILVAFAAVYIGISTYFTSHFFMNTEINGQDFSRKTVEDVQKYLQEQVQDYTLTILEKDNQTDTITGEEISLKYEENKDIEKVLKGQNAFMWPQCFFVKNTSKATIEVSYDRDALEKRIEGLQALKVEQVPPTSAYPKFNGTEFVVEPEVTGTQVDVDMLREKIHQYISEFQPELDMQTEKCYAMPKYTSESGDVKAACNEMNQYLQASITYSMEQPVVVDRTLISNWVSADKDMKVTFNESAVREWLREFGKQYDTVGKARTITTPTGKTVEVSGGTYGWSVDEEAEYTTLVNSIKNGEVVTKEPAYCIGQTAVTHSLPDWGNTYAEVDLSAQHMWYIVDGGIALETDVVTGYPSPQKETPAGVYSILEKEPNSTLVGEIDPATGQPEYRTLVRYWMRVTWSGIGFHDADWQGAFGGSLYTTSAGSHGCINMPVPMAASLFDMMPVGTPVIIHY